MPKKLPAKYIKRFGAICQDMADLINEMHADGHPDAVVFLEDGSPCLYANWPAEMDRRPHEQDAIGPYWHKSGGGGR